MATSASNTISATAARAQKITNAIFARTKTIGHYKIADAPDVDLDTIGTTLVEELGSISSTPSRNIQR